MFSSGLVVSNHCTACAASALTLLGGSWYLLTNYICTYNPTYNTPKGPYRGYQYHEPPSTHSQVFLVQGLRAVKKAFGSHSAGSLVCCTCHLCFLMACCELANK